MSACCCLIVALAAGCVTPSKDLSPRVSVTRAPAPALSGAAALPVIDESDARMHFTILDPDQMSGNSILWRNAREAFWSAEVEQASQLLREMRAVDAIGEALYWWALLTCYEASDLWAESLPLYAELGIEEKRRGWLEGARYMASLPRQQVEFSPEAPGLAMNREFGDLVIVEGTINGEKARVILDTGAEKTWISEKFARRANVQSLNRAAAMSDTHAISRAAAQCLIAEMKLGGLTARQVHVVAGSSLAMEQMKVDVIVGWDVLRGADVTWDFPGNVVSFAAPQGPAAVEPNLSGRSKPVLTVMSAEGRRLHLFYDSGFASNDGSIALYKGDGLLATKTALDRFRRHWPPWFTWGLNSFAIRWLPLARPFEIWMAGYRFSLPCATLEKGSPMTDGMLQYDGIIGNGPFLGGVLKMSGTRREMRFELAPPNDAASAKPAQ